MQGSVLRARWTIAWLVVTMTVVAGPAVAQSGASADARLLEAVQAGDRVLARTLVQQGIDVNAAEADGTTGPPLGGVSG